MMEKSDRMENAKIKLSLPWYAIALSLMMLMMLGANGTLLWYSSHGTRDLVRNDYYDAGLLQDKTIARNTLAKSLGMEAPLTLGKDFWTIATGSKILKNTNCTIYLYRPENAKEDQVIEMQASHQSKSDSTIWKHSTLILRPGKWIAKIVWESNNQAVMEKSYQLSL